MSGNWCTDVPSCVCYGYHIIICITAHSLLTHILSHVLFLHILSVYHICYLPMYYHIYIIGCIYLDTCFKVQFFLFSYCIWCCVSLIITYSIPCMPIDQRTVQLHIEIPTLENKEPEDLENHFPLASVVAVDASIRWREKLLVGSSRLTAQGNVVQSQHVGCRKQIVHRPSWL